MEQPVAAAVVDRAVGVLVGTAVGDALGAGYEFGGPFDPEVVTMRRGVLTGRPPGQWTDDTEMALAIVAAIRPGVDLTSPSALAEVGAGFLDWFRSGPLDIGNQTASVLGRAGDPSGLAEAAARYLADHPDNAAGNGSLMRTGVVALAALDDPEAAPRAARAVSALTHADPRCAAACVVWTAACVHAIRTGTIDLGVGLSALELEEDPTSWRELLGRVDRLDPPALTPNGFVVTSLAAAAWAIRVTTVADPRAHVDAALRRAVAIGHDTDTTAAIAGALLGAAYGASSFPPEWRANLGGWPDGLDDAGLVDLVERAIGA